MDNKEIIKEKLNYFLNNKAKVHIAKFNKEFLNGIIYGQLTSEIYLLKEDRLGNIKLFVSEVFDIEEFLERGDTK
jgi:hypothetical protein